jgi:hypothetical protein
MVRCIVVEKDDETFGGLYIRKGGFKNFRYITVVRTEDCLNYFLRNWLEGGVASGAFTFFWVAIHEGLRDV